MFTSAEKLKALIDVRTVTTRRRRAAEVPLAEEPSTERDFVRRFGAKVASLRLSGRKDFVGLMVLGKCKGFWVTADTKGNRYLRKLGISNGHINVTSTVIKLRNEDSVTNLQPGLLKWVQ